MVEREGSHWEWEPGGWADSRDSRALSAGEALQSLEGRDVTTVTSQTIGPAKAGTAAHRVSPQNSAGNESEICLCMFLWTLFMIIFFLILGHLKLGILWCNRKRNVERTMQPSSKPNSRSPGRFGGTSVRFYVKIAIITKPSQIIDYKTDYLYFI